MALFNPSDRAFAESISRMVYCNPFLPEQVEYEREALGDEYVEVGPVWSIRSDDDSMHPNLDKLLKRAEPLVAATRKRLANGTAKAAAEDERVIYEDLVLFTLYHRYSTRLNDLAVRALAGKRTSKRIGFYEDFLDDFNNFLEVPGTDLPNTYDPAHLFACFFQIRRAFHHIFSFIVGASMPAAQLRASIWQSIFTHDVARYQRVLYDKMGDITTLITGPSGTGKELVARAIGLSRYVPFHGESQSFTAEFAGTFHALNLSALSATLIESELFGHRRGAFTGALQDRSGWLEICPAVGTVFLDEIGDVTAQIQVKLLRVLQTRTFQRLGETDERKFEGKIIAATNRDLAQEMQAGRFREDFYYRLCSDLIVTPSLQEQLIEEPGEIRYLIAFIARRMAGDEAADLAAEVEEWIDSHLGRDYSWPGNVRELEQCVRNVLIRREYHPLSTPATNGRDAFTRAVGEGAFTAEELLCRYCTLVYAQTGSYEQTARRLNLDRRTVKRKIDPALLEQFKSRK